MTDIDTVSGTNRQELEQRLAELQARRADLEAECALQDDHGDIADRAMNFDVQIRLDDLDRRIEILWLRIQQGPGKRQTATDDTQAAAGAEVTVLFDGDEAPETYLLDDLDAATADIPVITPQSPLGRAIMRARPGERFTCRIGPGRTASASLVKVCNSPHR
jgi:transcription elongation factor GreA